MSPSGLFSRHGGGWCESLPERSPFGRLRLALSYLNLSPPWTWPIGVYFLSSIGYAIHKMEVPHVSEPTVEEVATLLDPSRLCKEDEDRIALWQKQRPVIMVVTALALGLRKLRAEVRRRVDAWKSLASSVGVAEQLTPHQLIAHDVQLIRDISPTPGRRIPFHSAFTRWASSNGEQFIRSLRWALPSRDSAIERTRYFIRCAANASQAKIVEALTGLGVPFNTSHGPTWGSGYTEWKVTRQLFHKPCACHER